MIQETQAYARVKPLNRQEKIKPKAWVLVHLSAGRGAHCKEVESKVHGEEI